VETALKPAAFSYHAPASVADAVSLLAQHANAKVLAGGQSLMPMLNMRFAAPDHLIDINKIAELTELQVTDRSIEVGAMVRQTSLLDNALVKQVCPLLIEALGHVGHMQTRSRGTIGGSLCHLDPAAELPLVALSLDAVLTVAGLRGRREIAVADWPLAYMTPNLQPDELLVKVSLPRWKAPHGFAFTEFARRRGDFAVVSIACLVELDASGSLRRAAVSIGGVSATPVRSAAAERVLLNVRPTSDLITEAATRAGEIEGVSDAYYSAEYRQRLVRTLTGRALNVALKRATGGIGHG
jgi:aerobic carbon-monoxide dehydrogenase medium subunit